jgi:DNA-directed RNA polymerase subunit K/omega
MVHRPVEISAFEFVKISALRAAQLMSGCRPRVESRHKLTHTAQQEVAEGKVARVVGDLQAAMHLAAAQAGGR